jgi:hypothetical protein
MNSTTRSSIFRDALRAGLKITTSQPWVRARAAQKIAIENVFPNRRGVLIITSELHFSQPFLRIMAGRSVAHSSRYKTRATHFVKLSWKES